MAPLSASARGVGFALLAALCYALSLVMARISYEHGSDPSSVMAMRFSILAVVLWTLARGRTHAALPVPERRQINACAVLYFIGIFSYLSAIAHLPVSLAAMVFYTFPLMVVLIESLLARRVPAAALVVALLLALGGLALALGAAGQGGGAARGYVFALLAAIGIALNLVFSTRLVRRVGPLRFLHRSAVVNALLAWALLALGSGLQLPADAIGLGAFALMLLAFFIGYSATCHAVRSISAAHFASVMNLEPVATLCFAAALLGEQLSARQWLGAAVVIVAVLMAQSRAAVGSEGGAARSEGEGRVR